MELTFKKWQVMANIIKQQNIESDDIIVVVSVLQTQLCK